MKKLKNLIAIMAISSLVFSCSTEEQELNTNQKENSKSNERVSSSNHRNYSSNSLVVRFIAGVSQADKQYLRNFYHVISHELCSHCADQRIELWYFDNTIAIEPRKITIDDPTNLGGTGPILQPPFNTYIEAVDYNFELRTASSASSKNSNMATSAAIDYSDFIKNSNSGVTIAVFDTGVNITGFDDSLLFSSQFLYNASSDGIPETVSGWDFVNNDEDSSDDNLGLHGTAVAKIINENLTTTPHQIMPLKICNENGKASYFNLVCALNYALDHRIDVLHMSLGWYDNDSGDLFDNIFLDLMSTHPKTIVVCSAGNDGTNNDDIVHCPSGYGINNIIAVASCNDTATDISSWSNYGQFSVDFFAVGENVAFSDVYIEGTSFAAPKVTAIVARLKYINPFITNGEVISALQSLGVESSSFITTDKPILYDMILFP